MKGYWHPDAQKQLAAFPQRVQTEIEQAVDRLETQGMALPTVGLASGHDIEMWRLVVDPDDSNAVNHRIIFDIHDDQFIIYGVWHRDDAYSPTMWDAVDQRQRAASD